MTHKETNREPGTAAPVVRSPLALPLFRNLYLANTFANFGGQIHVVAAAWLMATLTASPQIIALVQAAISTPVVLLSLMGGALADNFDRRRIMLTCQLFSVTGVVGLVAVVATCNITPVLLLVFIFVIQMGRALNNPAWHASVREIVPRVILGRAVALNSTSINLARTVGPAVGGVIVTVLGVAAAFVVNAVSLLGLAITVALWRPVQEVRTAPPEPLFGAMLTGVRYAFRSTYTLRAMMRGAASGFSASAVMSLLPVVARQELQGDATLFGFLLGAYGTGAVSGAMIGGVLREKWSIESVTRVALVSITAGLVCLGFADHAAIAVVGSALAGLGWVLSHSSLNTSVQLSAPRWVAARALSLYSTATFAAMVAGSIVFGALAEHTDVYTAYLVAGGLLALCGVLLLPFRLPDAQALDLDPLGRWQEPDIALDIDGRDGPILVELDYLVEPAEMDGFLAAMANRRRIRKRDGARDWGLRRSLQDERLWTESYRVPSWAEYVRHNQRRTRDDLDNDDALKPFRDRRPERRSLRLHLQSPVRSITPRQGGQG